MSSPPSAASARLDRLSALLEGLAPRVTQQALVLRHTEWTHVRAPKECTDPEGEPSVLLYLLMGGSVVLTTERDGARPVSVPAMLVCRSDASHRLAMAEVSDPPRLLCVRAHLDGPIASLLLEEFALPTLVDLKGDDASLLRMAELLADELAAPRCGQPALLERAGGILFIGLLRHLIASPRPGGSGLLHGLADPRIARALVLMHERPQAAWTLEQLADEAGMSRTSFANTFKAATRRSPGKYLSLVRLAIAQRAVDQGKGLKVAARESGYANTSALSRALSRAGALALQTAGS